MQNPMALFEHQTTDEDGSSLPVPVTATLALAAPAPSGDLGQLASMMQLAASLPQRDINRLKKEAVRIGRELKTDGYYSFPAGSGRIEGPSVWLMEALEGAWGCTCTQVQIDRVEGRRVHLKARFVDLKTAVIKERPAFYTMSDPPGRFAGKPEQAERWHQMQLASATSKAARSVLEHGLPSWLVESGLRAAMQAARDDLLKGRTIEQATKDMLGYFGEMQVTQAELESLVEQPVALWVDLTILELWDLFRALKDGKTTVGAVFGPLRKPNAEPPKEEPRGTSLGLKVKP